MKYFKISNYLIFSICFLLINYNSYSKVTGKVELENENNYSDIKVKFIPFSNTSFFRFYLYK